MVNVATAVGVLVCLALLVYALGKFRRFLRDNAHEREALEKALNRFTATARHGTGEGRRRLSDRIPGAEDVETLTLRIADLER